MMNKIDKINELEFAFVADATLEALEIDLDSHFLEDWSLFGVTQKVNLSEVFYDYTDKDDVVFVQTLCRKK